MTPTGHADFGVQNLLETNQGPKVLESSLARGPLQCQCEHYNSSQSQQGLRRVHWHGHASGLPGSMRRPPLARTRVPGPHWQTRTHSDPGCYSVGWQSLSASGPHWHWQAAATSGRPVPGRWATRSFNLTFTVTTVTGSSLSAFVSLSSKGRAGSQGPRSGMRRRARAIMMLRLLRRRRPRLAG
jgi:hypothetical protein